MKNIFESLENDYRRLTYANPKLLLKLVEHEKDTQKFLKRLKKRVNSN